MIDTPETVVRRYMSDIWNDGQVELIRTICADPVQRHQHDGTILRLSHDAQIDRISKHRAKNLPHFAPAVTISEGEYVAAIWNGNHADGSKTAGIEVFKVVDGRITDVWNNTSQPGNWG